MSFSTVGSSLQSLAVNDGRWFKELCLMPKVEAMNETDARAFVREAAINGVTLWVADGQLHFKAPKGKLTHDLRATLQSRKKELLGELSLPVFKKRVSSPSVVTFPVCRKGFWEESEANAAFRHSTHLAVKLTGKIKLERIESAFERLSRRHDLLRSRVRVGDDGIPFLQLDHDRMEPVSIVDLCGSGGSPLQVQAAVTRAIYAPFENARIYRAQVIKASERECVLAVVLHHFVADALSLEIVARELIGAINGTNDLEQQTGEPPLQYADYLLGLNEWLSGPGLQYRMGLWREKMRGAPEVRFPPADGGQGAGPCKLDVLTIHVGATLRAKLARTIASARVAMPFAVLAANFAALARTFQREDFFAVLLHSGRNEALLFDLVGFTVNCLPLRVRVSPRMSYMDLMTDVHDAFVFARDYEVPWGRLMPLMGEIDASYVAPLFNYQLEPEASGVSISSPHGGDFRVEAAAVDGPEPTNSVDWKSYELHAFDTGLEMRVAIKYMPSVYRSEGFKEFANTFLRCLEALAEDPGSRPHTNSQSVASRMVFGKNKGL